jgi:hypothetical protein
MGWGHLKIIFFRTTGSILTRLCTNHPWRERIQVSLKEGNSHFPRGDNSERVKIHRIFFKPSSPEPAHQNQSRVGSFENFILKNYEARKAEFYMKSF